MSDKVTLEEIRIQIAENGYVVKVSFEGPGGDDWRQDKYVHYLIDGVLDIVKDALCDASYRCVDER